MRQNTDSTKRHTRHAYSRIKCACKNRKNKCKKSDDACTNARIKISVLVRKACDAARTSMYVDVNIYNFRHEVWK